MAVIARDQVTVTDVTDVSAVYRYYLLQSSTLTSPDKPTTNPPGGSWSLTEPSYTAGSTNTLYFTDLTVFSNETFSYSDVSVSSSYEAAKTAYNKAATAQDTANGKNAVFYQTSAPGTSGRKLYDIWFDTDADNKMYYWDGSAWTVKQFGTGAIASESITADLLAAESVTADKIVARSITAAKIAANTITANEIAANTITADRLSVTSLSAISADLGAITAGSINIGSGKFTVTTAGALTATGADISGKITATSGTIGGWNITSTQINSTSEDGLITGLQKQDAGVWAIAVAATAMSDWSTAPFRVKHDGSLYATNAVISGEVNADSGTIGGLTIGSSGIYGNSGTYRSYYNLSGVTIRKSDNTLIANFGSDGFLVNDTSDSSKWSSLTATDLVIGGKYLDTLCIMTELKSGYYGMLGGGSNNVWIRTTQQGIIPYQSGGSGGLGTSSWPFNTAYIKTIYENGTALSSKYAAKSHTHSYLSLTGGTCTGNIQATNSAPNIYSLSSTSGCYVGIHSASSGNHGLYSNGYGATRTGSSSWIIYRSTSNTAVIPLNLTATIDNYAGGYSKAVVSIPTNGQRVCTLRTSSSTTFGVRAQWGTTGSTYSWKNVTTSASDIRLKENIRPSFESGLELINRIDLYAFDWKQEKTHRKLGFIADQLEQIDPDLAIGGGYEKDGVMSIKTVDTFYLQGYEVKAIQELYTQVQQLKEQIRKLQAV